MAHSRKPATPELSGIEPFLTVLTFQKCNVCGAGSVDRSIARLNIEHYKRLLAGEIDEAHRQVLLRLLVEEEAKLATLPPPERRSR